MCLVTHIPRMICCSILHMPCVIGALLLTSPGQYCLHAISSPVAFCCCRSLEWVVFCKPQYQSKQWITCLYLYSTLHRYKNLLLRAPSRSSCSPYLRCYLYEHSTPSPQYSCLTSDRIYHCSNSCHRPSSSKGMNVAAKANNAEGWELPP